MEFEFVRALGVLVAPVPGMNTDAKYLADDGILLYNPLLTSSERAAVSDQVAARVPVHSQALPEYW